LFLRHLLPVLRRFFNTDIRPIPSIPICEISPNLPMNPFSQESSVAFRPSVVASTGYKIYLPLRDQHGMGEDASVLRQKSLYFDCHSGLDPESSISGLDSRFRGNDSFGTNVKKCWTHHTRDDSRLVGLPDPARAGAADKESDSDPARETKIGGRNFFLPPIGPMD